MNCQAENRVLPAESPTPLLSPRSTASTLQARCRTVGQAVGMLLDRDGDGDIH